MPIKFLKSLLQLGGSPGAESRRFPNYNIVRVIHEGEKAFVYQARSTKDDRLYVVKVYKPAYHRTARRMLKRYRIRHEGEVGMILNPPAGIPEGDYPIVKTLSFDREFGSPEGCLYIVLEFVDGFSLKRMIGCAHPLLRARRLDVARSVARALTIMHEKGFVHRDLCADNVLVTKEGPVKLIDLGFAAPAGLGFEEKSGTPSYMSPEQCSGRPLNAASDLYSFGVVLFELFTGRLPFTSALPADNPKTAARRVSELMQQHLRAKPPALADFAKDVPPQVEALTMRCLEKNPERRPPSARQVMNDLFQMEDAPLPDGHAPAP
jgi:serine/threonine-protein kinase